jgi:transcriptional regulator with XRE-family HTH domain
MENSRVPYNRLRSFRRGMGYTRKQVARMVGLADKSPLSRWERGLAMPSMVQVFRLARICRVLPHELYDGLWKQIDLEMKAPGSKDEPSINNLPSDDE